MNVKFGRQSLNLVDFLDAISNWKARQPLEVDQYGLEFKASGLIEPFGIG